MQEGVWRNLYSVAVSKRCCAGGALSSCCCGTDAASNTTSFADGHLLSIFAAAGANDVDRVQHVLELFPERVFELKTAAAV